MIEKSLRQQINELKDSIGLIQDSLEKVRGGDKKYLKTIFAQLRSLVCSGSRNLDPLLFRISDKQKIDIFCYGPSQINEDEPSKGLVLCINLKIIGDFPYGPEVTQYKLKDWLKLRFIYVYDEFYTPNEIIRAMADKEGGAHYDQESDPKVSKLRRIVYVGENKIDLVESVIIQIAEFIVKATNGILKEN